MIYEPRKERLPGAELNNFWRSVDKGMGMGLGTSVETNLSSRAAHPPPQARCPGTRPALAEICSKAVAVHKDQRQRLGRAPYCL